MTFADFMSQYGVTILGTIITALSGIVATMANQMAKKYIDNQNDTTKLAVAKMVVQGVEQAYKKLNGEEKLNEAIKAMSEILEGKGIKITEFEMRMLLESAVGEFNKVFEDNTNHQEDTTEEELVGEE